MSKEFFDLFEKLVPETGQCESVQGEVVRAIGRISDDYFCNGSANWDAGYEILSSFALGHLTDGTFSPSASAGIRVDIQNIQAFGRGDGIGRFNIDEALDRLMQSAVAWCNSHPNRIPHATNPDLTR